MVMQSLAGLPAFLAYFCTAVVAVILYLAIYTWITAHKEFELIAQNVPGAAVALGLSLLGFALPLASAIAHSQNLLDCAIWGIIGLIVQIVVYFIVRIPVPRAVGAHRRRRDGGCDLARARLARRRRAERRGHVLLRRR